MQPKLPAARCCAWGKVRATTGCAANLCETDRPKGGAEDGDVHFVVNERVLCSVTTTFHALKASLREKLRTFSKNKGGFVQKPTPFARKSTVFERRLSAADENNGTSAVKMHNTR